MSKQATLRGAAGAMLLALTAATHGQQTERSTAVVSANGAEAIAIEPALEQVPVDVESVPEALARPGGSDDVGDVAPSSIDETDQPDAPDESASVAVDDQALAVEPSQTESLGLGAPNGLFSTRPIEESTESDVGEAEQQSTWDRITGTIDPRSNPVMRVVASLGLVLGLIVLFKIVMSRGAGLLGQSGRPSGVIEILARYPLGRKQSLVMIKLARRVLLVHQNGTQMTTLSEVAEPMEVASLLARVEAGSSGKQADRFRSMLKRFEQEYDALRQKQDRDDPFRTTVDSNAQGELIDLTRGRRNGLGGRRLSA